MYIFICYMFCEVNLIVFLIWDDFGVIRYGYVICFVYNVEFKVFIILFIMWRVYVYRFCKILGSVFE